MYSLTPTQKTMLQWLVQQIQDGKLSEDIVVIWLQQGVTVVSSQGKANLQAPSEFTRGVVEAFVRGGFLLSSSETAFTITGKAYEAVDSNFSVPDTSADITNVDRIDHNKRDTAKLRKQISQAFDDQELRIFCYDYFPLVYEYFTTGMNKALMVQLLIEHCDRNGQFDQLLERLNE